MHCFVKENYSIRIPIILGIRSFKPTVKHYGKAANECERIWHFSGDQLAICPYFRPKNCEFRFSVQTAKFRDFVRFPSKTILFSP